MPFNNAEGTIARCVESLLAQTLHDVELVFVDDGSTDRSVDSLRSAIANADRRVVVASTGDACRGTSFARQMGVDLA
ncbi:MAG: glycosyltransferase family A protein, partial [Bacteroidales bacterium]|nr:glycosyltransferase family A protein [Bacteroidales bacterium]